LISKRKTLEAALRIIDAEGLDALSVRRLAIELNVNAASLYHHFHDKEEILVGAAKLALDEVRTPETGDEHWSVWLLRNGDRLRRALVKHPDLVPIIMRRDVLGIGAAELESTTAMLVDDGVPLGAIAPIIEFGELLAIVFALAENEHKGASLPLAEFAHLRKASRKRGVSMEELFFIAYRAGADALVEAAKAADVLAASRQIKKPTRAVSAPRVTRAKTRAKSGAK
jgi:AcrR family transcriptional regulator